MDGLGDRAAGSHAMNAASMVPAIEAAHPANGEHDAHAAAGDLSRLQVPWPL